MSDFPTSDAGGMHDMFDLIRRQQKTNIDMRHAETKAAEQAGAAVDLQDRFDKLVLISMAMWSFISEKMGVTEEQLMDRVKQIDLMDGVADGKLRAQIAKCPKCGRVMAPHHSRCIYCGSEKLHITAFDDVV